MDDDDELYGDLTRPALPSVIELRGRLESVISKRKALEAQLEALQAEELQSREDIKDASRRACILLATARLELQRNDAQLKSLGVASCTLDITGAASLTTQHPDPNLVVQVMSSGDSGR